MGKYFELSSWNMATNDEHINTECLMSLVCEVRPTLKQGRIREQNGGEEDSVEWGRRHPPLRPLRAIGKMKI